MAKFVFVLPDMRPDGAERVGLTLIRELLERGHELDLVLTQAEGALLRQVPSGVRIVNLAAERIRHTIILLARYLRDEKPDAVLVSRWPLTVAAVIAHRLAVHAPAWS